MDEYELLEIIEEAARDGRTKLNLSFKRITSLPEEIGKLTNLTILYLHGNELTSIPKELGNLTNLTSLTLSGNQLTSVPETLGNLTNLNELDLNNNQLTSVPESLGNLINLTRLDLRSNQLTNIPEALGNLTNLTSLNLYRNQLTSVNEALGNLTSLTFLGLSGNQLSSVPKEIGQLTNLMELNLSENRLTSVPMELGELTCLIWLSLDRNQLSSVPEALGNLTNLKLLNLNINQLTSVPEALCNLTNLTRLVLSFNQLTSVPESLGNLTNLKTLDLSGNPLESPPPEVVKQGTKAVLAYLRELQIGEGLKWEAKLLVVGEAGVGKTEMVKALRGEDFGGESATEGILIRPLNVKNPKQPKVEMKLNLWDFGGQEIQHATHQFFYSERALFLLAWNARENYEQAKLNDWLELIQARASVKEDKEDEKQEWKVPVLMVATHCDLWRPDIPYEELKRQFPKIQFLGMLKVSNKPPRNGIEKLKATLAEAASNLPLMGMRWPDDWQEVENKLSARVEDKESRIGLSELRKLMDEAKVSEGSRELLIKVLDGMGKIRVFLDDEHLRDTVVLNPQWLTNRIARVLKNQDNDEKPICKHAILKRKQWPIFWPDESNETHRMFVRMMGNFDLVYELEDSPEEGWLVVQHLPYQLSKKDSERIKELWGNFKGKPEITMKFRMDQSLPPGIPTWFIAREHRFSLELHWRLGVLLADEPKKPRHIGLVQAFREKRYIQLTVRGPMPHNFFVLMKDGLEVTLKRYPGLNIKRMVPCPEGKGGCEHEFDFKDLEGFVERGQKHSQCQKTGSLIGVNKLLYGIHESTTDEIIQRVEELKKEMIQDLGVVLTEEIKTRDKLSAEHTIIIEELYENAALLQRGFTVLFNAQQELEETHCPNVFAVLPKDGQGWLKSLLGQKMVMQLYCQAPGQWHPAVEGAKGEGGRYEIKKPGEFLGSTGPYILKLAKVIKYAAPVAGAAAGMVAAGPGGAVIGAAAAKKLAVQVKLMEELAKKLADRDYMEAPDRKASKLTSRVNSENRETYTGDKFLAGGKAERIEGMELRFLRKLLDEVDTKQEWGGLKKVLTPEGHYLWLCKEHAEEYKK